MQVAAQTTAQVGAQSKLGRAAVAAAVVLTLSAARARADEQADAMRRAAERYRASVVRVEVTTRVAVERLPGLGQGARRTHEVSTGGVVVDGEGLVVFPAGALDPAALAYALLGRTAPAEVGEVRVVGADGRVRDAEWLGRDLASGLAFARVGAAGRDGLGPVRWAGAAPALGEPLLVISLTSSALGGEVRVDPARVAFSGERVHGVSPEPSQALGGLVIGPGGEAFGLLSNLPGAAGPPTGDVLRPDLLAEARRVYLIGHPTIAPLVAEPPREVEAQQARARERAWLGTRHAPLTPERAAQLGVEGVAGVVIEELYDGPAKAAGLAVGDVLVALDEVPLDLDPGESFDALVADYPVGSTVRLTVRRGEETKQVEVTLGPGPTRPEQAEHRRLAELGLLLRELTFFDRRPANLPPERSGAVVVELEPDGAASRAGLRPGDLILGLGGQPASSLSDVAERLSQPGEHVLLVRRRDQELTLRVRR